MCQRNSLHTITPLPAGRIDPRVHVYITFRSCHLNVLSYPVVLNLSAWRAVCTEEFGAHFQPLRSESTSDSAEEDSSITHLPSLSPLLLLLASHKSVCSLLAPPKPLSWSPPSTSTIQRSIHTYLGSQFILLSHRVPAVFLQSDLDYKFNICCKLSVFQ